MKEIALAGMRAAFDLGGVELGDGRRIVPGRLMRAGVVTPPPAETMSGSHLSRATQVIDLRSNREIHGGRVATLYAKGVKYSRIPVGGNTTRPRPGVFSSLAEMYLHLASNYGPALRSSIELIACQRDGGTLVHCRAGRDRTGLVIAIALWVAGVPDATVVAMHDTVAQSISGYVKTRRQEWIEKGRDVDHFDAMNRDPAGAMALVLRQLRKQYPRPEEYLMACRTEYPTASDLIDRLTDVREAG